MDKKAYIINIATSLFQKKGYMSVGLNELLSACNISRGAFYHHFPLGKEQLLITCLASLREFIAEDSKRIINNHNTTAEAVQAILKQLINDYTSKGTIVGYTFTSIVSEMGAVSEEVRKACTSLYEELETIISKKLEQDGKEREAAKQHALFIVSTIEGGIILTLTKKTVQPLEIIAHQLKRILE